jgi:hypothetical protein
MPDPVPPVLPDVPATRAAALAAAFVAFDALAELGETVEDEWSYVTALADAGRARLRAAVGDAAAGDSPTRSAAPAPLRLDRAAAVAAACAEVARITDPHRAIDWLSTFPAVIELAVGPAPDDAGTGA